MKLTLSLPKFLAATPTRSPLVDKVIDQYGDLVFDLCATVLWSPSSAQLAFRAILKEIRRIKPQEAYETYERAWILRIACEKLRQMVRRHGRRLSPSEQILLDATLNVQSRLKQFDSYFHRLATEDQILLLLKDKYKLPYAEISAVMAMPEGSLKIKRQQALRTLEEWLWDQV